MLTSFWGIYYFIRRKRRRYVHTNHQVQCHEIVQIEAKRIIRDYGQKLCAIQPRHPSRFFSFLVSTNIQVDPAASCEDYKSRAQQPQGSHGGSFCALSSCRCIISYHGSSLSSLIFSWNQ